MQRMFSQLIYYVANKQLTDMTQNKFCLIAEHSGVVKHASNKLNQIILINGICFSRSTSGNNYGIT